MPKTVIDSSSDQNIDSKLLAVLRLKQGPKWHISCNENGMLKLLIPSILFSTMAFADVNFNNFQISKSTLNFIQENSGKADFLEPSCQTIEACANFHYHKKIFCFRGDPRDAFDKLVSTTGAELFQGKAIFDLVYDPVQKNFLDRRDALPSITVGQRYFMELSVTKKMKIPVAIEIMEVDREAMILTFAYLKENKSNGIQRLQFRQTADGFKITHETRFKSDSVFRDALLYRHFHVQFLNSFYSGFQKNILKQP